MPGGLDDPDHLRDLFAAFGPVTVRRMFGGAGVFRDGLMFALVADDALYLKTDAATAPAFRAEGCEPFRYVTRGRTVALSYHGVPERLMDDPEAIAAWAHAAFAVALRAQAAKRPRSGDERLDGGL